MKKFEERVAVIYSDWDGSEADFKKKKRILQKEFHPDNGGSETLCKYANELKIEDVFGTKEDIVEKFIENEEDQKLLIKEISKLNDRDKSIIEWRYGLFGKKELTQKELANKMSISQSYISRIEKKVVKKLKLLLKI